MIDYGAVTDLSEKLDRPSSNMDEVHIKELAGMAEVWDQDECKAVLKVLARRCPELIFAELSSRHIVLKEAVENAVTRLAEI